MRHATKDKKGAALAKRWDAALKELNTVNDVLATVTAPNAKYTATVVAQYVARKNKLQQTVNKLGEQLQALGDVRSV